MSEQLDPVMAKPFQFQQWLVKKGIYDESASAEQMKAMMRVWEECGAPLANPPLIAVAFGDDWTTGDSSFYFEGIEVDGEATFEQIVDKYYKDVWERHYDGVDLSKEDVDTPQEFLEKYECQEMPVGFWLISEEVYRTIQNSATDCGSDSAVYSQNRAQKEAACAEAVRTVFNISDKHPREWYLTCECNALRDAFAKQYREEAIAAGAHDLLRE